MITLITAVPGSGKTLYAIDLIYKFNSEGRLVYQNIDGLKKEKFPYPDLIFDAPHDWRDTPEGSVVLYDEAQQSDLYPSTGKIGMVSDERLKAMETHRHSGHDLIFITQAPTLIHHHIRKLTGAHIHFYRARGLQRSSRYEWSHVCEHPNDRKEQQRADFSLWSFPKKYYDYYHSASLHTHKFSMPRKLKFLLLFLFILFAVVFYRLNQSSLLSSDGDGQATSHPTNHIEQQENLSVEVVESNPFEAENHEDEFVFKELNEFKGISGCVLNAKQRKCACYNYRGNPLDLNYNQCLLISKSNISKSIIKGGQSF